MRRPTWATRSERILLDSCTSSNAIGGTEPEFQNKILNSRGNGVTIRSSRRNAVPGNGIVGNLGYGLFASGLCTGTVVKSNTITSNAKECRRDERPAALCTFPDATRGVRRAPERSQRWTR